MQKVQCEARVYRLNVDNSVNISTFSFTLLDVTSFQNLWATGPARWSGPFAPPRDIPRQMGLSVQIVFFSLLHSPPPARRNGHTGNGQPLPESRPPANTTFASARQDEIRAGIGRFVESGSIQRARVVV